MNIHDFQNILPFCNSSTGQLMSVLFVYVSIVSVTVSKSIKENWYDCNLLPLALVIYFNDSITISFSLYQKQTVDQWLYLLFSILPSTSVYAVLSSTFLSVGIERYPQTLVYFWIKDIVRFMVVSFLFSMNPHLSDNFHWMTLVTCSCLRYIILVWA